MNEQTFLWYVTYHMFYFLLNSFVFFQFQNTARQDASLYKVTWPMTNCRYGSTIYAMKSPRVQQKAFRNSKLKTGNISQKMVCVFSYLVWSSDSEQDRTHFIKEDIPFDYRNIYFERKWQVEHFKNVMISQICVIEKILWIESTLIHLSAPSAANLATVAISSVSLVWSNWAFCRSTSSKFSISLSVFFSICLTSFDDSTDNSFILSVNLSSVKSTSS